MAEAEDEKNINKSKKEKWQEGISKQKDSKKSESLEDNRIYFVVFFLEKEWYGLKIENVSEIIKLSRIFSIPAPSVIFFFSL